jgi:hypothetical protein
LEVYRRKRTVPFLKKKAQAHLAAVEPVEGLYADKKAHANNVSTLLIILAYLRISTFHGLD